MRKTAFLPLRKSEPLPQHTAPGGDPGINWLVRDVADYANEEDAEVIRMNARPWERYQLGVAPRLAMGIGGAAAGVALTRRLSPRKTPMMEGLKDTVSDMGPTGWSQLGPRTKARFNVQHGGDTLGEMMTNQAAHQAASEGAIRMGATVAPPIFAAQNAWRERDDVTREKRLNDMITRAVNNSKARA